MGREVIRLIVAVGRRVDAGPIVRIDFRRGDNLTVRRGRAGPPRRVPLSRGFFSVSMSAELSRLFYEHPTEMSYSYDVFISYNSEDHDSVVELAMLLKRRGLSVWIDIWELQPGQPWVQGLEHAIRSCQSAIVAVGRSGMGPWQNVEMRSALMLIVNDKRPLIPVLLPDAPNRVELPIFLSGMTWVDLREGLEGPGITRLIWGVTGRKPEGPVSQTGSVSQGKAPARLEEVFCTSGLPGYNYIEPSIYQRVARDLRQAGKHVLISGPSGSGKTCLVFRILDEMRMQRDRDFIYISALDDNSDSNVREALSDALGNAHSLLVIVDDFHLLLRETRNALGKGLKQLADATFSRARVSKFVLVGISTSAEGLLFNATDLGPRLGVYRMPLAEDGDLSRLLRRGEERLAIEPPKPRRSHTRIKWKLLYLPISRTGSLSRQPRVSNLR